MDNKELLQSAKDEAAREYGYNDWETAIWEGNHNTLIINRAMEIYAEKFGDAQWNAAIEKAAESVALNFADYDKKQSILKLKKP